MSTSNQRRRRAIAKRNQRELAILAAPSVIIPRKGTVRTDGRSFFRAARDGRNLGAEGFTQEGKALGFMDANMREHVVKTVHIRPMKCWVDRDTAHYWKRQQANK